ncbi:uncharacterized protein BJ212DRAFT_1483099 [Suillus subaureus]|uniref:Uncharacterized protein n=1 Tax=Suillus subaureus TaxID=48587 RepID=A0A9P7E6C9_9AGAM|nr:uncharacterized protein BJ212DRAFT_1483099 [Suillus subaureus]KAG1812461.1 hypothetical protein BJ212DRAFT_1483099 [Suillus subaureus]
MSAPLSHADITLLAQLLIRLSPTGFITDCTSCGGAVTLSICRSDKNGNGGKPMARHTSCSFYWWYPKLLAFLHITSLIPMSTASPSPPSSQPITSSSSTTLTMLPPPLTQPLSRCQHKQGECPFHRLNNGPPMLGDKEDDFLIEEPEDGSFGHEDLCQALHASLQDLGFPIPDAPLPSMHNLLSALPAPIPCNHIQLPSIFLEGDSSPPPMDPIWATDLHAQARQEADDKQVEECRKEMEREVRQHFALHWFDADNAAVKVEWVSKCPYYPQWQLANDPELITSLGTDIHKIKSGCHLFLHCYGVIQCDGFQELLMASKHTSRPHHLWFNMTGEHDVMRKKLKAKQEIIEIPSSLVITAKHEWEESSELAFTPMCP